MLQIIMKCVNSIQRYKYFILADKIDLSSETDAQKDFKFAKWLSKNKKLQGIPPSAFFSKDHKGIGEPYIRFCFIKVCCSNYKLYTNEKYCLNIFYSSR